ncbi:hypothetical protein D6D01_06247 [Aureobasidium pullulans]|uniref:F-box domain-containing protein n=1 Tax=Aureobasidium pullulans TaxID=5580 RepID=A0A4S9L2A0_AURPU|nr:hypothetical protein D6D01_06247 [Aureobasidium pullulans]
MLDDSPMASFTDLPPEVRVYVYHCLIVDPIRDKLRVVLTLKKDGKIVYSRTTEPSAPDEPVSTDIPPTPLETSVSHVDYVDLLSLATTNKTLYQEATPIMYKHCDLKFTFGDFISMATSPTLLHTFLNKFEPANFALFDRLTVVDGSRNMSAKDVKGVVDLANSKLPNLKFFSIESINPALEAWVDGESPSFVQDYLRLIVASRPVACLASGPVISIKPRLLFYFESGITSDDPDTHVGMTFMRCMILALTPDITAHKYWRRAFQIYHATAYEDGDYLQLTSALRSESGMSEDTAEGLSDMEANLIKYQKILTRAKHFSDCLETISAGLAGTL